VKNWRWLGEELVLALHDEQITEHGGPAGLRDRGLLQSALARPRHLAAYGEPDACDLAAAYAYGIARNHPFVDGNKRIAFVAAAVFLYDQGDDLEVVEEDAVEAVLGLSAGEMTELAFATWLRAVIIPVDQQQ
jgi:death-on-curing protein